MTEIPEDAHAEIIRLDTSDENDHDQSEIADIVDRSDGVVSTVLKKYRHGEYLHPDADPVGIDPRIFTEDDWVFIARAMLDHEGGVRISRKILNNLVDD